MTYYSNNKAALAIQFFSCIAVTVKYTLRPACMVRNCTNGSLRIRITKLQYYNLDNIALPPQETNWSQISVQTAPGVTPGGLLLVKKQFSKLLGTTHQRKLKKKKKNACVEVAN